MKKMLLLATAMFALTLSSEAKFIGSEDDCDNLGDNNCYCETSYYFFWINYRTTEGFVYCP